MAKSPETNIDSVRTGAFLREKILSRGYSVRDVQEYLELSCPQPIYRWFSGRVLPSVDHLYALSRLLGVHMDELLIPAEAERAGKGKGNRGKNGGQGSCSGGSFGSGGYGGQEGPGQFFVLEKFLFGHFEYIDAERLAERHAFNFFRLMLGQLV